MTTTPPLELELHLEPCAGALAQVALRCPALGLAQSVGPLADPLSDQERAALRWYLEEYPKWPYAEFAERARRIEAELAQIGERLFAAAFAGAARALFETWRLHPGPQPRQLSVVSHLPAALSLPWELLRSEQGFLALRARQPVAIVRRVPSQSLPAFAQTFTPPLRVLLVTARPTRTGFVDPRGVARELLDTLQPQIEAGAVALEFLRPPTLPRLLARLAQDPPVHVLHFDGHGIFAQGAPDPDDPQRLVGGGQGRLAFEHDDGSLDEVEAERLALVLQDSGVRLAVLNACQSALGDGADVFSSVAGRLIKGGVDAVVAMSASVLVSAAARYVEGFYAALAQGQPVPEANERARQALQADPRRHLERIRPDDPGQLVHLHDWWLPHFYQQRPIELTPAGATLPPPAPAGGPARLSALMPPAPRYGWSGRARELWQIERWLREGKLVAVQGFGGVGKTALAREAADWLTRSGMYRSALFAPFAQGGDTAGLLSALATLLGCNDGGFRPDDLAAALDRLRPALRGWPTLVIADNLESVLPGGEAALPAEERARLWDALLALREAGAGLLLTSRSLAFGDGRLAPGRAAAHLALGGLHPDDAYALASRLLEDLQIPRERAPFVELRDLLAQLDGHPLAIQLVLPSLRDLPLARVAQEFAALLPRFADDTESGRNRSLLASLEYSLGRLGPAQRALLPRLAPFEGGALERTLTMIAGFSEAEWAELRPALEQAALLQVEQVDDSVTTPFLRFHPILTPYLRGLPGAADPARETRFAQGYAALAHTMYQADNRSPIQARAIVQRELPNLRRALDLLLAAGEMEIVAGFADSLVHFLNMFGQRRVIQELRRRVGQAAQSAGDTLSNADYLRESGLGEDAYQRGELRDALARFRRLLARIEALPEGGPLGRGSYAHSQTLGRTARCLEAGGNPSAAEQHLRAALAIMDRLLADQPDNLSYQHQRNGMLADLGDVLQEQGKYQDSKSVYEASLDGAKQTNNLRQQAVALGQLGMLALVQRNYAEATQRYQEALQLFQPLGEPASEAVIWHQLGTVAQRQRQWDEAERCYKASLALKEQLGDATGAARTCNHLAMIAESASRPGEAEGWYKRALATNALPEAIVATLCNNLAGLLLNEVKAGRAAQPRLSEARTYAERALAIMETLDLSSEPWNTLQILADIADLDGHPAEAQGYRRRARETFAAFPGNRWHIDRQHGPLIAALAAAARGDAQTRAAVEQALPQLEAKGWQIGAATQRLWAGERDWHSLCEQIDSNSALLLLRVLEELGQPGPAAGGQEQAPAATAPAGAPHAPGAGQPPADTDKHQAALERLKRWSKGGKQP